MSVLDQLIKETQQYQPVYGNRLANHLPMALRSLAAMGASDSVLTSYFELDSKKLQDRATATFNEDSGEHSTRVSDHQDTFEAYLTLYQQELSQQGIAQTIKDALPGLLPGLSASAFHAVIRLGFAVDANDEKEVAHALAYWNATFQPLPVMMNETNESLAEILLRVAPTGEEIQFEPGIIVDRMNQVANELRGQKVSIQPRILAFDHIRQICLNAFWQKNDFTLLHTVTGCHAFESLLPFIEEPEQPLRFLWQGIVVAYLSTGKSFDGIVALPDVADVDFEPLLHKATTSTNDHVIKLVYTCWQEYNRHKEPGYWLLANRAVGN